jgi:hypothetical protein
MPPVLLRIPGLAITDQNLRGLAERAIAAPGVDATQAYGAILQHVEEVALLAGELALGLQGKRHLAIHEDLTMSWVEDGT